MAVLTWDETGKKFYETGVDRGVLFPVNPTRRRPCCKRLWWG